MMNMGMQFGLENGSYCKRQNRWMFTIPKTVGDTGEVQCLPPSKSARPSISFKEIEVRHLTEDVYIPGKPEWKPITVTIFDLVKNVNPILNWMIKFYDPETGEITPASEFSTGGSEEGFIRNCSLDMLDGCGNTIESWVFEDCWPQAIDFQTLDYSQDQIMTIDLTLRYARAYIS